jgi:putative transposase
VISFKGRHHQQEIILQCVRWYVAYALSYRDLEELMQERGYAVDHSTVQRWVVHYAPRIEKAFRENKKQVGYFGPNQWDGLLLTYRHLCARLVMNHQLTVN